MTDSALTAEQNRVLLSHSTLMIWRATPDGKRDYFSDGWLAFRGRTLADECGDGWRDGVHADELAVWTHAGFETAAGASFETELRLRRHDGVYRWVFLHVIPVRDHAGRLVNVLGNCRDIDDVRNATLELRRSEENFRTVVEMMPEFVVVHREGRIVYANRAATLALGTGSADDLRGRPMSAIIAGEPGETAAERARELVATGIPVQYHGHLMLRRDGSTAPVDVTAQRIVYEGEPAVLAIAHDVTERLRREEEVRSRASQISAAEEAERRKIALELHDSIGQLLSVVKVQLATSARDARSGQLEGAHLAESVALIDHVIGQIRTMTFDLHPAMLDDLGLVPTLRRFADEFTARSRIFVTVSESGARRPLATALLGYLFRATKEMLNNVAKHAAAREAVVVVRWHASRLQVTVDDDGAGFDVAAVLAPGRRPGLGLASMRERTTSLGGKLEVESRPGEGTRVSLEVPI